MSSKSKLILGISLFFLLCASGLYFALQAWMPFMWFLLGFGFLGIAASVVREKSIIFEFFNLKTTKHGLSMGTVLILILCLLVIVNYFSMKFVHVFDLSMTGQYTLSSQSQKIIDYLDSDLEIKFFYKEGLQSADQNKKTFLSLAQVFAVYSPKIKISTIEMNSNPAQTELFGAQQGTGEGFVSYKGKINRIETQSLNRSGAVYSEQDFVNAIIKSTREKFKNIYFLSGHGERSIEDDKNENSYSLFSDALEKNSYKVQSLNLIQAGKIPEDADLIVIGGAVERLQKSEMVLMDAYLKNGHALLLFGDSYILHNLGWKLGSEYIFNILTTPQGPTISTNQPTVASVFPSESLITENFNNQRSVLFYQPHPLIPSGPVSDKMHADILIQTSDKSIALQRIDIANYEGKPKNFDLAVYFSGKYLNSNNNTDIVVVSDPQVASNQFFNQTSNKDFLMNTVSYLAKETDLVSIAPKEPAISKVKMTGPEFNSFFRWIVAGLFLPLPLIFLGLSIFIWFRRRHA